MTQKEFAASLSIGLTTYNGYETGARDPRSDFWIAVAKKYGVTIDYLMGHSDDPYKTYDTPKTAPPVSGEAMQLAKDYDTLDQWGRRAVRSAADNELARVKSQIDRERGRGVVLSPHTVAARGGNAEEGYPNDQIDENEVNAEVAKLNPHRGLDTR